MAPSDSASRRDRRPEARYQNYSEMKYDLEHPQTVRPFYRKNARLIERNPLLFFKIGFFVLFLINLVLLLAAFDEPQMT